jgi:carbonic anhydrase/acetyltransferase-like protein (isoleucine patch superfamily)
VVGSDVWIGRGATILSGITIGHGAVIGANSVVATDVRPFAVIVGNPGREVRRRFPDEEVDGLLRVSWWDWPIDVVLERVDELNASDVRGFLSRYDKQRVTSSKERVS